MMKKRITAVLLLVSAMVLACNGCKSDKLNDVNVVLIVIDALRSDHLPFYGYEKNTAPFLWELSKKAVVFENTFAPSSWTSPGTASIFTSMYPFQHGVLMGLLAIRSAQKIDPTVKINRIPEKITTLTEVLKKHGYRTFGVADNLNIDKRQGFTQGFDEFKTYMYKAAPTVNATVKSWKERLLAKGNYFLYIHYMEPHAPYHPRKPWYQRKKDRRADRISAYDSEINFVDQHIQELFRLFQWEQNTLVIITSDHGEGLWDHGKMTHGKSLYREEIQVPLLVYLPGGKVARRVDTNASTIDILPTLRDLLGLPPDKSDEGVSLVPLIEDRPQDLDDRYLYSYLWVKTTKTVEWKAAIYKKWHFILRMPNVKFLFFLLQDKKEEHNKYFSAYNTARILEQRFEQFMKTCKKYQQESSQYKLDKKETDKLKSLGYVE